MIAKTCRLPSSTTRGFTLIEVMVVVIILGILASVVMPRILDRPEQARQIRTRADIRSLQTALASFHLDTGRFPTTSEGLQALVENSGVRNWRQGGYLQDGRVPNDPWGRPYRYLSPGSGGRDYDLLSYGRDGQPGGSGYDAEIRSWEID